jgi:SAM-dependent methyltransferase
MTQSPLDRVRRGYDAVATQYAEHLFGELASKPFDREALAAFAARHAGRGRVLDIGTGPGHVARFLADHGAEVVGLDISPAMVAEARRRSPDMTFVEGDFRAPPAGLGTFAGAVAFYALVHTPPGELTATFASLAALLEPGGELLLALHLGDGATHVEELWGVAVDMRFEMFEERAVLDALEAAGYRTTWSQVREPYPDVEYPSRRLYASAVLQGARM